MRKRSMRISTGAGRKLAATSFVASLVFTGVGGMAMAEDGQTPDPVQGAVDEVTTTTAAPTTTTLPPTTLPPVPTSVTLPPTTLPSAPTSVTLPPVPTSVTLPPVDGEVVIDTMLGKISASCNSSGDIAIELSNPQMGLKPIKLTLDASATIGQVSQLAKTFNISTGAIETALNSVTDCSAVGPDILADPSQPPPPPGGITGEPMADIAVNCLSDGTVDVKLINPTLVPRVFSVLVGDVQVANPTIQPGTSPTIKIDMAEDATAVVTVQVGVLEITNTVELDCLINNSLPLSLLSLFNKAGTTPPAVLGTTVTPAAATLPRTGSDSALFIAAGLAFAALGLFAARAARQAKDAQLL